MFQTNPDFGGVSAYRLLLENPSAFACASIVLELLARGAAARLASGRGSASESHPECVEWQFGAQVVWHRPTRHLAAVGVEYDRQV